MQYKLHNYNEFKRDINKYLVFYYNIKKIFDYFLTLIFKHTINSLL